MRAASAKNLRISDRSVVRTKHSTLACHVIVIPDVHFGLVSQLCLVCFVCVSARAFRTMSVDNDGFQCLLRANKYTRAAIVARRQTGR